MNDGENSLCAKDTGQPAPAELEYPVEMKIMVFAVVVGVPGRRSTGWFLVTHGGGGNGFQGSGGGFGGHTQQRFLLVHDGGSSERNQEEKAGEEEVFCVHNQRIMTQTCPCSWPENKVGNAQKKDPADVR